jgi:hypothetical protein
MAEAPFPLVLQETKAVAGPHAHRKGVIDSKQSQLFTLSASDLKILRLVGQLRFVRALDLAYRLSRPTSLTYYRERLSALSAIEKDAPGFLSRISQPSIKKGERAWVYSLSVKGARALSQEGAYLPPYKLRRLSYGFLQHSLCLTSFICAAHYFVRTNPSYTLSRELLSYALVQNPPTVTLQTEKHTTTITVVPDAFLCFERDGEKFPILLEIDRGTEYQFMLKKKLRNLIILIRSGAYARYFQLPGVIVAYATIGEHPSRETRRAAMQQWALETIDEMITKEHRQGWYEVFRFCALPDSIYEHHINTIFEDRIWYTAGSDTAVPLFDPPSNR